jgi:hypothetical protein
MLTLCRLLEPVEIRPPQSPHLRPFTFFTTRARQTDGSDHLYLHMGFFESMAQAERWAQAVRGRHPEAIATFAPPAFWQLPDSEEPPCPAVDEPLTDTQVLAILERRHPVDAQNGAGRRESDQIELLRPEDTGTRLALKEAVARGAPVSFAVQLQWSSRPLDLTGLPALALLKAHTLYGVESRRASRSCFFLRLGFFGDPVSAKEVAFHVRSHFPEAAVIPVLDEEITRARQACMDTTLIPCLVQQRPEPTESNGTVDRASVSKPERGRRRSLTLEQTLRRLAEREKWTDPDLLSDTGVRHLKVEVAG